MKKIDLHTHTVSTISDHQFTFDLEKLLQYVSFAQIDAIGITNHNLFDIDQYRTIADNLTALVIPGIEINVESGHLLVLADPSDVVDFDSRCLKVASALSAPSSFLQLHKFKEIFPDLSRYLIIPHYEKKPVVPAEIIESLGDAITAGEVASPKKFEYCKKNQDNLVPVYFTDIRFSTTLDSFPIRQTYVNIGDVTFGAIKYALSDKNKVYLTPQGHGYFQANNQGLILSTGLNVIIGERSSGKTHTLNQLQSNFDRVKYIKQFSLVERSDPEDSERFNSVLRHKQSLFVQDFLKEFKFCVDDVSAIDLETEERNLEQYLAALLQHAKEHEKADAYSKACLFSETEFPVSSLESLNKVINSAVILAENEEFRSIIEKHISLSVLVPMIIELIEHYIAEKEVGLKQVWVNDVITSIKTELQRKTAAIPIPQIDFFEFALNRERIKKFLEVTSYLQQEKQIYTQDIQNFKIVAQTKQFTGAQELKNLSGKQIAFSSAFQSYSEPYVYLKQLRLIEGLPASEYYKFFAAIEYKILNKFGSDVSGGERSEFRLLQEISDAQQFDMLLIDEPESSFDNIFLHSEVNQLIKDISKSMPVVIVTHNSTVGASIKPDYLLHTKRVIKAGQASYVVYSGHPSDKFLKSIDGSTQENHHILLNCLEAGQTAYTERGNAYETLKN